MDYEKIGNFLYKLRKDRNLTQQDLANRFFISREAISKWERGISLPDYPSLIALSKFYNITINEILAGEKLDDHNKDRIEAVALTILENSEKEIKKSKKINIITILIAIIILLGMYIFYSYNSIHIYTISGNNNEFAIESGTIFVYQDKAYLNLGYIYKPDGKTLSNDDGYKVSIYYGKDNKKYFYRSNNVENIYINLYAYKDMINNKSLKEVLDNLYIDFEKDDKISTIKLNKELFYANDFKTFIIGDREIYSFKAREDTRSLKDNEVIIDNKKYTYEINKDTLILVDENGILFEYYSENNYVIVTHNNSIINYYYEHDLCYPKKSDCEEYMPVINYIKSTLIEELGLS